MRSFSYGRYVMGVLVYMLSLGCPFEAHQDLACAEPAQNKPVRLKSKELMSRLDHCISPVFFGSADQKGKVIVEVLINPEGKVECVKAKTGPPLLAGPVIKAVKQWTFKVPKNNKQNAQISGDLVFYLSWEKPWYCPAKADSKSLDIGGN